MFQEFEPHFRFLLTDHNFVVAEREKLDSFDFRHVVYHSAQCRVQVGLDRGTVYILLAHSDQESDYWIDISTVVSFLTQGRVDDVYERYDVRFERELPYFERIDSQASKLSLALRDYLPDICLLFANMPVERVRSELGAYGIERMERRAGLT